MEESKLNSEKICKIQKKSKLPIFSKSFHYSTYALPYFLSLFIIHLTFILYFPYLIENMEESKLNSEKICKIQKKSKLNSEKI
jgi:hypothetical protein